MGYGDLKRPFKGLPRDCANFHNGDYFLRELLKIKISKHSNITVRKHYFDLPPRSSLFVIIRWFRTRAWTVVRFFTKYINQNFWNEKNKILRFYCFFLRFRIWSLCNSSSKKRIRFGWFIWMITNRFGSFSFSLLEDSKSDFVCLTVIRLRGWSIIGSCFGFFSWSEPESFAATRLTSLTKAGFGLSTYSSLSESDEDWCRRFRFCSISFLRSFFDFFSGSWSS